MKSQAVAKRLRVSPQKVRLIANQIRGKGVAEAFDILQYDVQKGAPLVRKVLDSAVANAVYINEGLRLKRFRARARGRGARIVKRTCHVTVAVSDGRDDDSDLNL